MDTPSTPGLPEAYSSSEALQESIKATAALIATMQKREQSLHDQIARQLQALHDAVGNADRSVNRVVENALPRLTQLTQQALSVALDPATQRFDRTLAAASKTLEQATQRYAQAQQSVEATAMRRMWMASIAMLAAGAMGLGGVGYLLHSARATLAEAEQRRAEISYLDRVARANLVPCGEDRLCADFEKNGPQQCGAQPPWQQRSGHRGASLRRMPPWDARRQVRGLWRPRRMANAGGGCRLRNRS